MLTRIVTSIFGACHWESTGFDIRGNHGARCRVFSQTPPASTAVTSVPIYFSLDKHREPELTTVQRNALAIPPSLHPSIPRDPTRGLQIFFADIGLQVRLFASGGKEGERRVSGGVIVNVSGRVIVTCSGAPVFKGPVFAAA
ncbi:hypothetical protein EYF80_036009 [Liparis tanakae]|uniref:Uncharacterized protein n=1 Tax=Liparis tanakae TaxID=230148 RepID=A0A4Z2GM69_9TELE|nr:hypothetical protein EYF80_036009 [Liparis tanakae]